MLRSALHDVSVHPPWGAAHKIGPAFSFLRIPLPAGRLHRPFAGFFSMDPSVSQTVPEVIRTVPLQYYVFFASALFAIGVTGVLVRRNAIIIFMCVELMLNAVNILLTAFSAYRADPNGQIFVFFIMAVAAAEVSVGLGIIVMIYRNFQTTDVNLLSRLKW
jgi:NADH-quinone oxidoreductase subunit K